MHDVDIRTELERDPAGIREPGMSRDPERTPMRWDGTRHGGFTTGTPWLPIGRRASRRSTSRPSGPIPGSMLTLHRRLLALRRAEPALAVGGYVPLGVAGDVIAYERRAGTTPFSSFSTWADRRGSPAGVGDRSGHGRPFHGPDAEGQPFEGNRPLAPDEGLIVRLPRRR